MLRGVQAGDQAEAPPAGQVVPGLVCKRLARAQARPPSSPPPLQRQGVQFCNGESNASYRIMAGFRVVLLFGGSDSCAGALPEQRIEGSGTWMHACVRFL